MSAAPSCRRPRRRARRHRPTSCVRGSRPPLAVLELREQQQVAARAARVGRSRDASRSGRGRPRPGRPGRCPSSSISVMPLSAASGVRSSCDASATNRRWMSALASSRSTIVSKATPEPADLGRRVAGSPTRTSRSPALMRCAASTTRSSGRSRIRVSGSPSSDAEQDGREQADDERGPQLRERAVAALERRGHGRHREQVAVGGPDRLDGQQGAGRSRRRRSVGPASPRRRPRSISSAVGDRPRRHVRDRGRRGDRAAGRATSPRPTCPARRSPRRGSGPRVGRRSGAGSGSVEASPPGPVTAAGRVSSRVTMRSTESVVRAPTSSSRNDSRPRYSAKPRIGDDRDDQRDVGDR